MDYKELIRLSKKAATEWKGSHEYYQAATLLELLCAAIETILEERDTAMKDLGEIPCRKTCKNGDKCDYINAVTGLPDCFSCCEWEWRGATE